MNLSDHREHRSSLREQFCVHDDPTNSATRSDSEWQFKFNSIGS